MAEQARSIPVYTVVAADKNYTVQRNGIALKTPAGAMLAMPTKALAEALAGEWRAQGEKIIPASMPLTQLASTAIDITRKNRDAVVDEVARYADTDLLCFRAETPDELVLRQKKIWQPVLDWCAKRFDAPLKTGQGVVPLRQSPEALSALRYAVEVLDDFALTGLKHTAEVSGSLVLALALFERHLTAEQVFEAAELEAHFQVEKWGDDPVTAKRHETIKNDLAVCEKWFGLLATNA